MAELVGFDFVYVLLLVLWSKSFPNDAEYASLSIFSQQVFYFLCFHWVRVFFCYSFQTTWSTEIGIHRIKCSTRIRRLDLVRLRVAKNGTNMSGLMFQLINSTNIMDNKKRRQTYKYEKISKQKSCTKFWTKNELFMLTRFNSFANSSCNQDIQIETIERTWTTLSMLHCVHLFVDCTSRPLNLATCQTINRIPKCAQKNNDKIMEENNKENYTHARILLMEASYHVYGWVFLCQNNMVDYGVTFILSLSYTNKSARKKCYTSISTVIYLLRLSDDMAKDFLFISFALNVMLCFPAIFCCMHFLQIV